MFRDRSEAGQKLAKRLEAYYDKQTVVLAIPRGGVVVGIEIAQFLNAQLDLIIPRKIGAPGNPELAIGAVAGDGQVILNEELSQQLGIPDSYVREEVARQVQEISRRRQLYLAGRPPVSLEGKTAIITDDGLATGFTALAAVRATKKQLPDRLVLAVPVAPKDTCARLASEVDEIVCLETPMFFMAVGQFYLDFDQVTDEEVIAMLRSYEQRRAG